VSIATNILIFALLALVTHLVVYRWTLRDRKMAERLSSFLEGEPAAKGSLGILGTFRQTMSRRINDNDQGALKLRERLVQAGLEHLQPGEFTVIRWGLLLLLAGAGFALRGPVAGVIGAALGALAPNGYLALRTQQRVGVMERQLADATDLMANGLRAGNSLQQALDQVRRESPQPLANEFDLLLRTATFGSGIHDGCVQMVQRVPSADIKLFTAAVLIQRQVGGNLAEILDGTSQTIRERLEMRGQIRALTSQGRLSAVVIASVPVGLIALLALINPSYISLELTTSIGHVVLGAAAMMEIAGFLWMRKIVAMDI